MSLTRKLERDRLLADLRQVERLLGDADRDDYLGRLALEERRDELRAMTLEAGEAAGTASAALYFGGTPVVGSRGIESGFGGTVVSKFQDLVSKLLIEQRSGLGQRGPLPAHDDAKLHITGVVRGSFGFVLEELQSQPSMFDSELKGAVTKAVRILEAFGDSSEQSFEEALASADPRSLVAAKDLFSLLSSNGASLRLVTETQQLSFGELELERAQQRAITSSVNEIEETIDGVLGGILPEQHTFELKNAGTRGVIYGRVTKDISSEELETLLATHLNKPVTVTVRVRQAVRRDEVARETFLLRALSGRAARPTGV